MAWAISPGGTFASLAVTGCTRNMQSGGRSTCQITMAKNLASSSLWAEDDVVTVTGPGGTFFSGVVERPARSASGATQEHVLTLTTKWKWLEEIGYTQPFACGAASTSIRKSSVVLGMADDGTRQTTAQIVAGILTFANGQGAGLTLGSILAGATLKPPLMQMADVTCAEAIRAVLKWHPDAVLWFAPDGTMNITKPANLTAVARVVGGSAATSRCELWPRQDMGLRGVVIHYEITTTVDGVAYLDIANDTAGAATGRRVAHFTIPLVGSNIITQQQEIQTRDIPDTLAELGPWLILQCPELAAANPVAGELTALAFSQNVAADEKVGQGAALASYPRELIKGQIQPWMTGVSAAPTRITINLKFTGTVAANPKLAELFPSVDKTQEFYVELTGTDARDQSYRTSTGSGPETVPSGLAAEFFAAFQDVPSEGEYTSLAAAPDVGVYPGHKLSLSGSATVTDSPVQSSTTDAFSGATTVKFGPLNRSLSPSNFLELLRAGQRQQPLVNPNSSIRTDAAAGGSGNTIHGAGGGRWKNTSRQFKATGGITPWLCARIDALKLRVYPAMITDGRGHSVWCTYAGVTATPESYFDITLTASYGTGWLYLQCSVDDSDDQHGIIDDAELLLTNTTPTWYQLNSGIVNIPVCQVVVGSTTFTLEQIRTFAFSLRRFGPPMEEGTWDVQATG